MSRLSVIIPTLNEERYVGALLSDVAAQTRKPEEVLVVDAGSKDGTVSIVWRFLALGKFGWANHIDYEFGGHEH